MSYNDIVKKYEGRRRRQIALVVIFGIVVLAVIIGTDIFVQSLFTDFETAVNPHLIGAALLLPACILIIAVIALAVGVLVWQMKKTRAQIKSIQETTGLTDNELFAEVISSSETLPSLKNVYVSDEYLINLDSFWGCRIDSITDVKTERTPACTDTDIQHIMVIVCHDGKSNSIYTSELSQKKVYEAVYDLWQRSRAADKR